MHASRRDRTINSALWSAYGDILGFPTELVDQLGVQRRLGEPKISFPKKWKRLVGGRGGVWVELDAGSYSDDTQLRLSTSRAIRADGYFDVEAFAKVELPVWLSYCLGAGRGSKVGASSLSQRSANWFTNFFEQRDIVYTSGGGNGAAMRIQPHVWAAQDLGNPASYLPEVIQNSICTHGHPRGIAGAVLHAVCLAHILNHGEIPPPTEWKMLGSFVSIGTHFIEENADLSTFWLPTWNARTGRQFAEEMELVREEWERDAAIAEEIIVSRKNGAYEHIIEMLGGFSAQERGSGIKSALFSLAAAWLNRNMAVDAALVQVANLLGSDTDTIGTMTGALLGALHPGIPPAGAIRDSEYIISEADRMVKIANESCDISFAYPDLLDWQPPKTQLDSVGRTVDGFVIAGLGKAHAVGEEFRATNSDAAWQWFELNFGQTILCKKRLNVGPLMGGNALAGYTVGAPVAKTNNKNQPVAAQKKSLPKMHVDSHGKRDPQRRSEAQDLLARSSAGNNFNGHPPRRARNIDEMTDNAIRNGFNPEEIGSDLLFLADLPDGIEKAVSYTAVIIKARKARLRRGVD